MNSGIIASSRVRGGEGTIEPELIYSNNEMVFTDNNNVYSDGYLIQ